MIDNEDPGANHVLGPIPIFDGVTGLLKKVSQVVAALEQLSTKRIELAAELALNISQLKPSRYRKDEKLCLRANYILDVFDLFEEVGLMRPITIAEFRREAESMLPSRVGLDRDVTRVRNVAIAYFNNASPREVGPKDGRMHRARAVAAEREGSVTADAIEKAMQRVKDGWLELDPVSMRFRIDDTKRLMCYLPSKSGRPRRL